MPSYSASRSPCPIGRASRVLGDRWALLVLREAFLGVDRFDTFIERLPISRAALTSRLQMLVHAGIMERQPPTGKRATYRLTKAGEDLFPTLTALRQWADRWLFEEGHKPLPLHTRFDEDVAPVIVTTFTGRRIEAADRRAST